MPISMSLMGFVKSGRAVMPVRSRYEAKELQKHARAVDYQAIIGDSRVLFLGEIHNRTNIKEEIMSLAPRLRQLGFTHLAMEAFHSATQEHWDYYDRGEITKEDIISQEMVWHKDTREFDNPNWFPPEKMVYEPYFEIVEAARQSRLKILGIEWCRYDGEPLAVHRRENYPEMGLTLEFMRSLVKENRRQDGLMSELYYCIFDNLSPARNWHAAKVLSRELEDPSARIAVLGGIKHVGRLTGGRDNHSLPTLLKKFSGISGPSVYFAVRQYPEIVAIHESSPSIGEAVFRGTWGTELARQRFMLKMDQASEEQIDRPDYIIHLPS